jgi:predicted ester cyclase
VLSDGISTPARLLRGFATDFLTCHDLTVVSRIMDPGYRLTIGDHVFDGRDNAYLPATAAQLEQFPGLCVTVHDVILGPDAVAMRFTEHGVSRKHNGRAAAWGGITMFRLENERLRYGWAEEDYFARKRQLASGHCDPVAAPHPAPWDVTVESPDRAATNIARAWLTDPHALRNTVQIDEISSAGPSFAELIEVEELSVEELFSAGERVAFRVVGRGGYAGGFTDVDRSLIGHRVALSVMGLLTMRSGQISNVQIAFDRLGLRRSLPAST